MGNKKIAKSIAMKVGVPCLDDYSILSNEKMFKINQKAKNIGYPIMLKSHKWWWWKGNASCIRAKGSKKFIKFSKS